MSPSGVYPRKPKPASAAQTSAALAKADDTPVACPACGHALETLGKNRLGQPIQVCRSCGREFGRAADPTPAPDPAAPTTGHRPVAPRSLGHHAAAPARPCRVEGCPGSLDADGQCAACTKRAAWAEAHVPVKRCEICDGPVQKGGRKHCKACRKIAKLAYPSTTEGRS